MQRAWMDQFPGLSSLDRAERDTLVAESKIVEVPQNTVIFGPGKAPEYLLLLLEGSVRVQQASENGREIVLYRVAAGESCVLTTACLLAYEDYRAEGIAETDVTAVAVPRGTFDSLIGRSAAFRKFVFTAYSRRITDLFFVIEEIAFRRLDIRLAQHLIRLGAGADSIEVTHQQLAIELGSAREVVSRQLQEFQRRGWLSLGRGSIQILNAAALAVLARSQ